MEITSASNNTWSRSLHHTCTILAATVRDRFPLLSFVKTFLKPRPEFERGSLLTVKGQGYFPGGFDKCAKKLSQVSFRTTKQLGNGGHKFWRCALSLLTSSVAEFRGVEPGVLNATLPRNRRRRAIVSARVYVCVCEFPRAISRGQTGS